MGLPQMSGLNAGETAAIALAEPLHADLLSVDQRVGFRDVQARGLRVIGTLGVLDMAADQALIAFTDAIRKLERTNFRRPEPLRKLLQPKHREGGNA